MVLFFGPAGAGKSVQGQILAARHGWRWLSSGQLLRDSRDPEIMEQMRLGALVSTEQTNSVISDALDRAKDIDTVILDGYPRKLDQVKWLDTVTADYGRSIKVAIVLEVPRSELESRLRVRGRVDDTMEVIENRLMVYRKEIYPILTYLTEANIRIAHIDGTGTVGAVHDRIEMELGALGISSDGSAL
ncbi:nucleoside monophosphate kinase [Candidatus Saccharibacteria bacterium]|nr:nucleoside monophosphate kinase [Candidatus Saccharibacteria bacterium]